jgi:hypothetical protein
MYALNRHKDLKVDLASRLGPLEIQVVNRPNDVRSIVLEAAKTAALDAYNKIISLNIEPMESGLVPIGADYVNTLAVVSSLSVQRDGYIRVVHIHAVKNNHKQNYLLLEWSTWSIWRLSYSQRNEYVNFLELIDYNYNNPELFKE